jgi:ATP-dependent 26S proteasome regulatory subunit
MRRFDAVIEYTLPDKNVALQVLKNRLGLLKTKGVNWTAVQKVAAGLSHADLARVCEVAAKNAILARRTHVETTELVHALKERRAAHA